MKQQHDAIHVEFKTNGQHFYFGSIAAIYQLFKRLTPEQFEKLKNYLYNGNNV